MKFFSRFSIFLLFLSIILMNGCDKNDLSAPNKSDKAITPHSVINFDNFNLELNDFGEKIILVDSVFSDPTLYSDVKTATGGFIEEMDDYRDSLEGDMYIADFRSFGNQLRVAWFGIYKDNKLIQSFSDESCTCDPPPFPSGGCPDGYSNIATCHSESCVRDAVAEYAKTNLTSSGDTVDIQLNRGWVSVTVCGKHN